MWLGFKHGDWLWNHAKAPCFEEMASDDEVRLGCSNFAGGEEWRMGDSSQLLASFGLLTKPVLN